MPERLHFHLHVEFLRSHVLTSSVCAHPVEVVTVSGLSSGEQAAAWRVTRTATMNGWVNVATVNDVQTGANGYGRVSWVWGIARWEVGATWQSVYCTGDSSEQMCQGGLYSVKKLYLGRNVFLCHRGSPCT